MVSSSLSNTQPVAILGRPLQVFHLHHAGLVRWGNLLVSLACLSGAAAVLVFGAYQTSLNYYRFGPAIVWKTIEFPLVLEVVLLVSGLLEARVAYFNWKREISLYENGLTYQDHRGIQVWRWNEIQSLRNNTFRNYAAFLLTGETHLCIIEKNRGESLVINDGFENAAELISVIRSKVFPRLYAQHVDQLRCGQLLKFGPLTLSLAGGIEYHQRTYRLENIQSTGTVNGSLILSLKDGRKWEKLKVSTTNLPNMDVLLALLADLKAKNSVEPA